MNELSQLLNATVVADAAYDAAGDAVSDAWEARRQAISKLAEHVGFEPGQILHFHTPDGRVYMMETCTDPQSFDDITPSKVIQVGE